MALIKTQQEGKFSFIFYGNSPKSVLQYLSEPNHKSRLKFYINDKIIPQCDFKDNI